MPHSFTAYFGMLDCDAASFAGDSAIADFLILAAIALVILYGTEYPFAK
jgi:hypothetical protein